MSVARPTVSVLMPAYNAGSTIAASVESILRQSRADFELVVVDDGSTDNTQDVLSGFQDPRLRRVRHEQNLGLPVALNRGLETCLGTYIARMDADDVCSRDRLEKQVGLMERDGSLVVVGSWARVTDGKGTLWKMPTGSDEAQAEVAFRSPFIHPSVVIRSGALGSHGLRYDETLTHAAEDWDLWRRLRQVGGFANVAEPLVTYTVSMTGPDAHVSQVKWRNGTSVVRRLLGELGIDDDEEGVRLHQKIGSRLPMATMEEVTRCREWLNELRGANATRDVYPDQAFLAALARAWFDVCYSSASLGPRILTEYRKADLGPGYGFDPLRNVKFLARTIVLRSRELSP